MSHLLAVFELMAGASFVQYLVIKNKEHGVGAMLPIILVNMIEGLVSIFANQIGRNYEFLWLLALLQLLS